MIAALLLALSARAADCRPLALPDPYEAQTLLPGERLVVGQHAGLTYVLAASGEHGLMGEEFVDEHDPTYQLVLHALDARDPEGRPLDSQVLFSQESPPRLPILRWAGDLDGDGRPDLLLDLAAGETALLLSRSAAEGMVQAAAPGRRAGC